MNQPIGMSPHELVMMFVGMCAAFATVAGAVTILVNWINKARQPEVRQNERISNLEEHVAKIDEHLNKIDEYLDRDAERFRQIETTNEITLEALYALLSHAIDGNNTSNLQTSQKKLHDYLFKHTGKVD